jgi:hypothetical protein
MEAPRIIPSRLEVKGAITSNGVAVPTASSTTTLTNKTLTTPALTAPAISGAATLASGATITTPTIIPTLASVTATGATGGSGAVLPTVTPAFVTITGATGSGVDLPTGPAGLAYFLNNVAAAAMRIYCVGGTINGTTGTTAAIITNTGNHCAWAYNTSASGAWQLAGNT